MNLEEFADIQRAAIHCPHCSSQNLSLTEEGLFCKDCQSHFSLNDSNLKALEKARILLERAQERMVPYHKASASVLKELNQAKDLLEKSLKENPEDVDTALELALVNLTIGDAYMSEPEKRNPQAGLKAYRRAVHAIQTAQKEKPAVQNLLIEGLIEDKMVIALNDLHEQKEELAHRKRAIELFEAYLNQPQEEISENNIRIATHYLTRNLWLQSQALLEENRLEEMIVNEEKLLPLFDRLEELEPENKRAFQTAKALIYSQLGRISDSLPEAFKESGGLLEEFDEQAGAAELLCWLGLITPQEKEEILSRLDEPESLSDKSGPKQPSPLSRQWDFSAEMNRHIEGLLKTCHDPEQALEMIEILIDLMQMTSETDQKLSTLSGFMLSLYDLAQAFREKGFLQAAIYAYVESLAYGQKALNLDLDSKEAFILENFMGRIAMDTAKFAILTEAELDVCTAFLNMARYHFDKLERQGALIKPALYGEMLLLEQSRLIIEGKEQEAQKLDQKIEHYLDRNNRETIEAIARKFRENFS